MKEAQTDITFQGLWLWTAIASTRGLCYPTAEPDEAVFTHNESWEKEKPPLSFKAF